MPASNSPALSARRQNARGNWSSYFTGQRVTFAGSISPISYTIENLGANYTRLCLIKPRRSVTFSGVRFRVQVM